MECKVDCTVEKYNSTYGKKYARRTQNVKILKITLNTEILQNIFSSTIWSEKSILYKISNIKVTL